MTKKYVSNNLNEAAYLVLKGLKCKSKYTGLVSATHSFEWTRTLERYRKEFWTTGSKVSIHSWLATRQEIKNELRGQANNEHPLSVKAQKKRRVIATLKGDGDGLPFQPKPGEKYYTKVDTNVFSFIYGDRGIHLERASKGQCYKTKEEAILHDI